jgi:hypothetical protein
MAGALCGITHLPDFELISVDVVECIPLLLLDCVLQVIDSFRRQNVDHKGVRTIGAGNPAGERDFGGHVSSDHVCHVQSRDRPRTMRIAGRAIVKYA